MEELGRLHAKAAEELKRGAGPGQGQCTCLGLRFFDWLFEEDGPVGLVALMSLARAVFSTPGQGFASGTRRVLQAFALVHDDEVISPATLILRVCCAMLILCLLSGLDVLLKFTQFAKLQLPCYVTLQVKNVRNAFVAFFCILSAYFVQLPTRDESGVALGELRVDLSDRTVFVCHFAARHRCEYAQNKLRSAGTAALPKLFVASFFLTIVVSPCVSAFLLTQAVYVPAARHPFTLPHTPHTRVLRATTVCYLPRRDRALLLLYGGLAACTLLFFLLFLMLSLPAPRSPFVPLTIRAVQPKPSTAELGAVAERVDTQRRLLQSDSSLALSACQLLAEGCGHQVPHAVGLSGHFQDGSGAAPDPEQDSDPRGAAAQAWDAHSLAPAIHGGSGAGARAQHGLGRLTQSHRLQQALLKRPRDPVAGHERPLSGVHTGGAAEDAAHAASGGLARGRRLQQAPLKRLRGAVPVNERPAGAGVRDAAEEGARGARPGGRRPPRRSEVSVRGGDQSLSAAQRGVRAAFYLWLGTANLATPKPYSTPYSPICAVLNFVIICPCLRTCIEKRWKGVRGRARWIWRALSLLRTGCAACSGDGPLSCSRGTDARAACRSPSPRCGRACRTCSAATPGCACSGSSAQEPLAVRAVCAEDFAMPWVLAWIKPTPWAAKICQRVARAVLPKMSDGWFPQASMRASLSTVLAQTCAWMDDADPESRCPSTSMASPSSLISHTPTSYAEGNIGISQASLPAPWARADLHPLLRYVCCCGTVAAAVQRAASRGIAAGAIHNMKDQREHVCRPAGGQPGRGSVPPAAAPLRRSGGWRAAAGAAAAGGAVAGGCGTVCGAAAPRARRRCSRYWRDSGWRRRATRRGWPTAGVLNGASLKWAPKSWRLQRAAAARCRLSEYCDSRSYGRCLQGLRDVAAC